MVGILKNISINIIVFLFLYSILEILTGQIIFKKKYKCSYILCNADYNYKTNLYSTEKIHIKYKKDMHGLRGREKSLSKVNILVIGGSTTDERYLNLDDTWVEKLEKNFKKKGKNIDIVNAGIDGQSSYGHIWSLENWINRIEGFSPEYILFYFGINEKNISGRHDFNPKEAKYPKKIWYYLKYNDGITNKIYELIFLKLNPIDELNVAHSKEREAKYVNVNNSKKYEFINLKQNVFKMIDLSLSLNSKPILVTQRTKRWQIINDKVLSISVSEDYYSREKKISDIIIAGCKEKKAICIDGFSIIKFDDDDTYDLVHTTPKGSEKIADVLFDQIGYINFN